jgi:protein-L-isoaspartate(D-aspartate) O-methyltransferase
MVDYERARRTMVDNQLRTANVTDRRILSVMGRVPREIFVPDDRKPVAYIDDIQPLGAAGRSMPAPAPFAKLIQLAAISSDDHVLDLGAGTGYSTAVLAGLARQVTGIEENGALVAAANANLASLGIANAKVTEGPLTLGGKGHYDVVVVEGALDAVPHALFDRLADGGRLVAMIRQGATAVANVYVKTGRGIAARAEFNSSLPPLTADRKEEDFVF